MKFNERLKLAFRIAKSEQGANYLLGNSLGSSQVASLFGTGGDAINPIEEYNGFAWKAINIRAEMLSDQDLFVERLINNKWQADQTHPFNLVLEGGDGSGDLSELLEAHSKSMDMYGESFWYFSKAENSSKPYAAYLLNPNSMTVMVADNKVTGYIYQQDGDRVILDLDEVAYFRIHDPRSKFRGYGPMQAAGWFIRSNRYVNTYVNNFLENNAIPAGVIVAKEGFTNDADWKLFMSQWQAKHSGVDNAGKTGFVRSASLDFVKTGMSLGEVDFEKIKNTSREDVMVMFGVSKPMMAIFDDINYASAVTARQLFAMTNTSPMLKRLERKLSKKVAKWYGVQYRVNGTNPVPEDEQSKLEKFDKLLGRAFTVNEVRAEYGKDPLPGGDELNPDVKPATPKSIGKITIKSKTKGDFSYEMKESFRSQTEDLQVKAEQSFLQISNKVLKDQKARVIEQLTPKKVVDARFDATAEAEVLATEVVPLFIGLAIDQGQLAVEFAGNKDLTFKFSASDEKYIRDSVAKATLGFSEETQTLIAKAIADGLNEGESIAKISKRIDAIYKDILGIKQPGYRIERLARTEVIKTSNEITEMAYKQTGVVSKKEWFANPGACQFCNSLNGSIIALGGTYVPKGGTIEGTEGGSYKADYEDIKHPGAHPACRCTLLPVLE